MSHMVKSKNIMNLKDTKTQVTVGESITLTITKRGDWHGYQICGGKIHCVTLSNTAVIPVLNFILFSMTQALHKGFQVMQEGETLILKINSTSISFDKKYPTTAAKDLF